MTQTVELQDDERRLAELGYKQELQRAWSGFSNFAISFTIISVLAGCFTTYGQAWNNGGPIAISWGWPIICGLILLVAFSMPFSPAAVPWRDEFDWRYVNYAPVTVGGLLLIVGVWWAVRARHTFKGPIRNVEFDDGAGIQ